MLVSSLFMTSYLVGYAKGNNQEWVDEILEKYISSPEMSETVFITMRGLGVSDRYANSILNLINKNWLSLDALKSIYFDSISIKTLKSIISHLITGNHPQYYSIIFRLVNEWRKKNNFHDREITIFFLSLLENSPDDWMGWHNWEEICQFYLNMFTLEITQITLKLMKHTRYSPPYGNTDQRINILKIALTIKPKEVWNLIGHQMITGDWDSLIQTSEFIKNINQNLLIDWAKENSPLGHQILAEYTDLEINKDLARKLIIEFDDELTNRYLHPQHYPIGGFYSYWGKYTEHLANYFAVLEPFLNDKNPKVQEWANGVYQDIKQRIENNQQKDEEDDLFYR